MLLLTLCGVLHVLFSSVLCVTFSQPRLPFVESEDTSVQTSSEKTEGELQNGFMGDNSRKSTGCEREMPSSAAGGDSIHNEKKLVTSTGTSPQPQNMSTQVIV